MKPGLRKRMILHHFISVLVDINAYQYLGRLDQEVDLLLFTKTNINLIMGKEYSFNTMECADFNIKLPSKTIHLGLIYRPPDGSVLQFCQELTTYLEQNINTTGDTLLMGDLNIPHK